MCQLEKDSLALCDSISSRRRDIVTLDKVIKEYSENITKGGSERTKINLTIFMRYEAKLAKVAIISDKDLKKDLKLNI